MVIADAGEQHMARNASRTSAKLPAPTNGARLVMNRPDRFVTQLTTHPMDIATLLAPISAEHPSGVDLSFSPEVDAIQEMRREDDPTLDQGAWVSALKSADWGGVVRSCETILATKSKDLRVVGWLVDAWARLRSFEGLADGLELTAGLIESGWEQLHPMADDGDQEQRIGNLRWLAARTEQLATTIPLVSHGARRTTVAAINGARARRLTSLANTAAGTSAPNAPQPAEGSPAEPALTLEMIWRDVNASGREAARARRMQVTRARTALTRVQTAVDERLQDEAPSFVAPRAALDKVLDELARLERECGLEAAITAQPVAPQADALLAGQPLPSAPANNTAAATPGQILTRAQALEQLRLVADFFRTTEPHSPVAYLADKAVRWSEMPLHEWLRAVVKDGVSLAHLEEMLGVDKPGAAA